MLFWVISPTRQERKYKMQTNVDVKKISTESRNQNTKNIDLLNSFEIAQKINEEDKIVALAVESELEHIGQAIDMVSKQFLKGGHLIYFGAGTSGRLGVLDASECPPTFSVPHEMVQGIIAGGDSAFKTPIEGAEDNFEAGKFNAKILTENDIAVVISASGNPKYLLGVLEYANEVNAKTIAITCNSKAKIAEEASLTICVEVGPEVIAGSSRMKAGTAQKMVLNMISTGAMINGGCQIGNRCFVGSNSTIGQGVTVCDDVVIGAGAVVIKDITEPGTYVGNPCRKIK